MLFEEPILEQKKTTKSVSSIETLNFVGDCEISKFHKNLQDKNLHHAILLPEIYSYFQALLQDFLNYFCKEDYERFDLKPNENGNILIENFEEALSFAQKTSFTSKKIIIIYGVCELSLSVANALLKILEEPPKETFFLLIYRKKDVILSTIRSRAVLISFKNSYQNFSFLYNNFVKSDVGEQEVWEMTGGNINLLPIFLNQDASVIRNDFNKLISENFSYLKFKKFFITHNQKSIFFSLICLLIEFEISKKALKDTKFYFSFILQKKYVSIYNTNLEAFLYYTIYCLC
jgi:hypothetical protein